MPASILIRPVDLPASERALGLTCPFCKDALAGARFVECAACATWFHEECFLENRGCMTMGCREQRLKIQARAAERAAVLPPTALSPVRPRAGDRPRRARADAPATARATRSLEGTLALIHAAALGTLAMIPVLASRHAWALVPVAVLAAVLGYTLERWLCARGPAKSRLGAGSQLVCILCGLFAGGVGVPLLFLGAASLLEAATYH